MRIDFNPGVSRMAPIRRISAVRTTGPREIDKDDERDIDHGNSGAIVTISNEGRALLAHDQRITEEELDTEKRSRGLKQLFDAANADPAANAART